MSLTARPTPSVLEPLRLSSGGVLTRVAFAAFVASFLVLAGCDSTRFQGESSSKEPTLDPTRVPADLNGDGTISPDEMDAAKKGTGENGTTGRSPNGEPLSGNGTTGSGMDMGMGSGGGGSGGGGLFDAPGQGGGSGGGIATGHSPHTAGGGGGSQQGGAGGILGNKPGSGTGSGGGSGGVVADGDVPLVVSRSPEGEIFPSPSTLPSAGSGTGSGMGGGTGGGTGGGGPGTVGTGQGQGGGSGGGLAGGDEGIGRNPSGEPFPGSGQHGGGDGSKGGGGTIPGGKVTPTPIDKGVPTPRPTPAYPPIIVRRVPDPEQFPAPPVVEPKPTPPPGKVLLELKVIQLAYEAWWKNCLDVTVGGETKEITCNKTAGAIGTTRYFFADKPPACNPVRVSVRTYKNVGDTCTQRQRAGLECNGPFASNPDWKRNPAIGADGDFFRGYDWATIVNRDPLIKFPFDYAALQRAMEAFRNGGANRWMRVFFEDQPRENLEAVRRLPAQWEGKGIDYNDTIFDVKGENVRFYVEGAGPQGCSGQ